ATCLDPLHDALPILRIPVNEAPPAEMVSPMWISYPSSRHPPSLPQKSSEADTNPSALALFFCPVKMVSTGSRSRPSIETGPPSPDRTSTRLNSRHVS